MEGQHEAVLGRQPILDARLQTQGYELLYRAARTHTDAQFPEARQATTTVLANALIDFGIERVVGNLPAWVNFPDTYLLERLPIPLEPRQLVVEVLEDARPTPALVEELRRLSALGYQLALDDCAFDNALRPLLELATFVKIDVRAHELEELERQVELFRPFGAMLLAEKVETMVEFGVCRDLGFQRFQGYFLARPEVVARKRPPANRLAVVRLLAQLNAPNASIEELARLISEDPSLSYRLMRSLNSSLYALPRQVESVHQAIVMLGLQKLKSLATLLVIGGVEGAPSELITTALVRGRTCELLAAVAGVAAPTLFTVGVFSLLDAVVGRPMNEVLDGLPLTEEIRAAIEGGQGMAGQVLCAVVAQERGDWDAIKSPLTAETVSAAHLSALPWVRLLAPLTTLPPPRPARHGHVMG